MSTKPTTPVTPVAASTGAVIDAAAVPGTAVVSWKDKMAAITAQAVQSEAPKGGYLSFKGGNISFNDDLIPGNKLNVIVLDFLLENYHFAEAYSGGSAIPVCFAFGREESELAPHKDAEDPQSDECGTSGEEGCCPLNEWGSASNGGRGKGCANSRRVAVIAADCIPKGLDAIKKASVLMLKVPVTSVYLFSKFVNQTAQALETPPFGVIVELSTKPDKKNLFSVNWKVIGQTTDQEVLEALYNKRMSIQDKLFAPYVKIEPEAEKSTRSGKF